MGKQAVTPAEPSEVVILPREIAEETPRQLSEEEHKAIVAALVARETSELRAENDSLKAANGDLQDKLDVAETARQTAESAKETAEQALTDYKAEQEQAKEVAERVDERVAKVREVASHLKDDFFTDKRKQRWAAMEEDDFADLVKEMAAASGGTTQDDNNEAPRETAMHGREVKPKDSQRGAGASVLSMRRKGA